jgi:hypothetical protein
MRCRRAAVIRVDSEQMGDLTTTYLIFILFLNIDVNIYFFMSQYMQYYMYTHTNEKSMQ